jgi:hypothetical protein
MIINYKRLFLSALTGNSAKKGDSFIFKQGKRHQKHRKVGKKPSW